MFPLGTVLLPTELLPLHDFEHRYRVLVRRCLDSTREFGVALIERGSEVGGGDVRTDVGTVARIVEVAELPDGRFAVGCIGTRRIRVERWLDDDPHPWAEVSDWPDPMPGPGFGEVLERVTRRVRTALALRAELGEAAAPATLELSPDPVHAAAQVAVLAPLGAHDRQRLLSAASPDRRLEVLAEALEEAIDGLRLRLSGG